MRQYLAKFKPSVFLPGESCGQRSLVGCCPWGCTELDLTEVTKHACMHWRRKWQPTPVFLPGESQDGGAWWAAVYGVAQSRTQLKRRSSSSSSKLSVQFPKGVKKKKKNHPWRTLLHKIVKAAHPLTSCRRSMTSHSWRKRWARSMSFSVNNSWTILCCS